MPFFFPHLHVLFETPMYEDSYEEDELCDYKLMAPKKDKEGVRLRKQEEGVKEITV